MTGDFDANADLLRRATRHWPAGTRRVVRSYLRELHGSARRRDAAAEPYWVLLPRWIYASANTAARRKLGAEFLRDVAWGQYCLYLCVRIQDDLFDGQAKDLRLLFVANQLLLESERAFDPHVPAAFWPIHRSLLETTTSAILDADERQAGGKAAADGLAVHARVASIFKTGAAAVCLATGRPLVFSRISALADELAIMSQVFDDLCDLVEDLDRGRMNSVGALLLDRSAAGRTTEDAANALGASLLFGDGAGRLLAALRASHARAAAASRELRLPDASGYLDDVGQNIERLATTLHRTRVEARFGRTLTAAALRAR